MPRTNTAHVRRSEALHCINLSNIDFLSRARAAKSTHAPVCHRITFIKRLKVKSSAATVLTSLLWESAVRRSSPEQLRVNVWTPAEDSGGKSLQLCTCSVRESSGTNSYHAPPYTDSTFLPLPPAPPVPRLRSPPLTHQRAFTQSRKDRVPCASCASSRTSSDNTHHHF